MGFSKASRLVEAVNNLSSIQDAIKNQLASIDQKALKEATFYTDCIIDDSESLSNNVNRRPFTGKNNCQDSMISIFKLEKVCIRINNNVQNIAIRIEDKDLRLIRFEVISEDNTPNSIFYYCAQDGEFINLHDSYGDHSIFFSNISMASETLKAEYIKKKIQDIGEVSSSGTTNTPELLAA